MNSRLFVVPTGDEIKNGTVLDTDSPLIRSLWLDRFPSDEVIICEPVDDDPALISDRILALKNKAGLIVLIGGSGGGHRYVSTLGKDYTHTALDELLDPSESKSIYGYNGHLWCRLIAGFLDEVMVINVPGPYEEAKAAFTAFCNTIGSAGLTQKCDREQLRIINERMCEAVIDTYEK